MTLRDTKLTKAARAFAQTVLWHINSSPKTPSLDDMTGLAYRYLLREVDQLQSPRTTVFPGMVVTIGQPDHDDRPDPSRCINGKDRGWHVFSHTHGPYGQGIPVCKNCGAWFADGLDGYAVPTFEEDVANTTDLLRPGVAERRSTFARPLNEQEEMQIYALCHEARLIGGIPALSREFNRILDGLKGSPSE